MFKKIKIKLNTPVYYTPCIIQIQRACQLEAVDEVLRMSFANEYIRIMDAHPEYNWLWSDESSFSLNGHVASNTMVRMSCKELAIFFINIAYIPPHQTRSLTKKCLVVIFFWYDRFFNRIVFECIDLLHSTPCLVYP